MTPSPNTKAATTEELIETATKTTTEDVHFQTHDNFTKFTCKEVYGFSSIATSEDYSETTDSLSDLLQIGVTVESPNGVEELIVVAPENLLMVPIEQREEIVEAMFNEGELWIAQHKDIFSKGLFPKMWDTVIAPTTKEVEDITRYASKGITNMGPEGVEESFFMGSGLALTVSSFLLTGSITMAATGSSGLALTTAFIGSMASLKLTKPLLNISDRLFSLNTPHIWAQRNRDVEDLPSSTISPELEEKVKTILTTFTEDWTSATVIEVEEDDSETTLNLFTEMGGEVTVTVPTPSDTTDDFLINRIMNNTGVSSMHMLEGKELEITLSSLGREDDTTKENYRIRSK